MNSRNWCQLHDICENNFQLGKSLISVTLLCQVTQTQFCYAYFQRFPRDWDIPWDLSFAKTSPNTPQVIFHSTFQRKLKRSFSTPYYKTIKLLESNLSLQFLLLCIHYVFTFIKIIFPLCFKHSSSRSPPSINVLSGESSSVVCKYAHFFKRPKLSLIPHILFLLYKLYNPFPLNSQTLKNSSQILF